MLTRLKANRKKVFILTGCLLTAIVAVAVGMIVYQNSDKAKVRKYLDMGDRYLTELQYEQAVVEYTKAFELDPDDPVVVGNLVTAYSNWSDALVAEGNYEKAIEILTQGYEATGDVSLGDQLETIRDKYQYEILHDLSANIKNELYELGIGGSPSAGKYRTFDEKKEIFTPVINDLNEYVDKMELYSEQTPQEEFPNYDIDAFCNGIPGSDSLPDILTPGYVYAALSVCYLHIGEMENCFNARVKLADAIGDETILSDHYDRDGNIEYDRYGRTLRNISGGFSFAYSDGSANNETRAETGYELRECKYENGRLAEETITYGDSYQYHTYSYQGDTVNDSCYSDIGVMQYETNDVFHIDKYGNSDRDTQAWTISDP